MLPFVEGNVFDRQLLAQEKVGYIRGQTSLKHILLG